MGANESPGAIVLAQYTGQYGQEMAAGAIASLIPLLLLSIGFAIGNYFVARRIGKSGGLWAFLTLIPIFNLFFMYYVIYQIILKMFDRLNAIQAQVER